MHVSRALDIFEKTSRRLESDRWETGLIWKEDNNDALRRLGCSEREMEQDILFKKKYCEEMERRRTNKLHTSILFGI